MPWRHTSFMLDWCRTATTVADWIGDPVQVYYFYSVRARASRLGTKLKVSSLKKPQKTTTILYFVLSVCPVLPPSCCASSLLTHAIQITSESLFLFGKLVSVITAIYQTDVFPWFTRVIFYNKMTSWVLIEPIGLIHSWVTLIQLIELHS